MPDPNAQEVILASGKTSSSYLEPMYYIPLEPLRRLGMRCQTGVERKGDKAWNALSPNQDVLLDRQFFLERVSHTIAHAMKLRDRLARGETLIDGDDEAAAIMWAGMFFCCATRAMDDARSKPEPKRCSACGGSGRYISIGATQEMDCPACRGSGASRL